MDSGYVWRLGPRRGQVPEDEVTGGTLGRADKGNKLREASVKGELRTKEQRSKGDVARRYPAWLLLPCGGLGLLIPLLKTSVESLQQFLTLREDGNLDFPLGGEFKTRNSAHFFEVKVVTPQFSK